jgi:hypothetical protein
MSATEPYEFDTPVGQWHRKLARLYEQWLEMHPAPDLLPGRQHFNPGDVADLMPLIWALEVHHDPLRFRYCLVGEIHAKAMQRELNGLWMHEAHAEFIKSHLYRHYVNLVNQRQPSYRKGRARYRAAPELFDMERVMLPMAANGRDVDMVLALTVYYYRDGTEAFT